ncbi:hypothetical protein [Thiocystis violacea]|uniref:hypothetical protein n=1 Tax=Thiocystis violacea TaxID=13725 RepID=UPI001904E94A|nr:hypothetical protein [Thiocystis violacea]
MDTGAAKAIEVLVIAALVIGFYVQQQNALKRTNTDESKTKEDADAPSAEPDKKP